MTPFSTRRADRPGDRRGQRYRRGDVPHADDGRRVVIIADVDRERAEALSAELPGSSVLMLDITDEAAVHGAFGKLARLDILVNNAGIGLVGNIEETEHADFERLFRVNVTGTFLVTQGAMPKLLRRTDAW